jgi:hypothetical protein
MPPAVLEVRSIGHGAAPCPFTNESLPCLRDAALCGDHPRVLDQALDRSLGIAAPLGGGTVRGLLSRLAGSLPAAALACSPEVPA